MIKENKVQSEIDHKNNEYLSICKSKPKEGFHKSIALLKKGENIESAKGVGESLINLAFTGQLLGLITKGDQATQYKVKSQPKNHTKYNK